MGVRLTVRARGGDAREEAVFELDQDRILVGRGSGADVVLPHRSVSVHHATIEQRAGGYVLVDHRSTNGVRVNGTRVVPERGKPLRDGDEITIGAFAIAWKQGVAASGTMSAERTATVARRILRDLLGGADDSGGPRLVVSNGPHEGEILELPPPPGRVRIGRAPECELAIDDADASREHVEIQVDLDGVIARDLGSKNGLLVQGRRVAERRLVDRDELQIGSTYVTFEDPDGGALRDAQRGDDEPFEEPSLPPPPPEPADDPDAPTGEPAAEQPAREPSRRVSLAPPASAPKPGIASAELVVYVLAALVFLASVAGLWFLLRT